MLSHQFDRRSSADSFPRMSGSVPIGIATSNVRPTSVPKNSGGVTPTTVKGTRSMIDRPTDSVCGAAEALLPEVVTDDRYRTVRSAAAPIVVLRERAAEQRSDAENIEVTAAGPYAVHELGLTSLREVEAGWRGGHRSFPERLPLTDLFPDGIGKPGSRHQAGGVFRAEHDEPLRFAHRKAPHDQAVENREDRGIRAYPERQGEHGHNRDDRSGPERSECVTNVGHASFDEKALRLVGVLLMVHNLRVCLRCGRPKGRSLQLEGVYSVLPTPFTASGDLDELSLRKVIDLFIGAGVHGVTALGVTGEVARLDDSERAVCSRSLSNT